MGDEPQRRGNLAQADKRGLLDMCYLLPTQHTTHKTERYKRKSLRTLDLSGWSGLDGVRDDFLSNCSALTQVDLSGWSSVTRVGDNFLSNCTSLRTLDLSGWSSVAAPLGRHFLGQCCLREISVNATGSNDLVLARVKKCYLSEKCQCTCM